MSIWATGILSKQAVKAHATAKDPWANAWLKTHMVSTGPYVLSKSTPGVEYDFTPEQVLLGQGALPVQRGNRRQSDPETRRTGCF